MHIQIMAEQQECISGMPVQYVFFCFLPYIQYLNHPYPANHSTRGPSLPPSSPLDAIHADPRRPLGGFALFCGAQEQPPRV